MTNAKHTPGPWKHESRPAARGDLHSVSIYSPCGLPRETGWSHFDIQPYSKPSEAEANARLIVAAPSMYEFVTSKANNGDNEAAILLKQIHGE